MNRIRTIKRTTVEEIRVIDLGPDLTIDVEMLYALCDADGSFDFITILDPALRRRLETARHIRTNVKGGSYATEKLKNIAREENLNI
jgi:hypothetical protein